MKRRKEDSIFIVMVNPHKYVTLYRNYTTTEAIVAKHVDTTRYMVMISGNTYRLSQKRTSKRYTSNKTATLFHVTPNTHLKINCKESCD